MEKSKLHELIDKFLEGKTDREEARKLKQWYDFYEDQPDYTTHLDEEEKQTLGHSMLEAILSRNSIGQKEKRHTSTIIYPWSYAAAACVVLLLLAFGYFQFIDASLVIHQTAYGQFKTITLPDRSEVTLNGNSTLKYKAGWNDEADREVWLEGEAFFSVTHQQNNQKFLVHTPEALQVEVLGTEFSVMQRKTGTSVALKSGSVKLHIPKPLVSGQAPGEVMMVPGEIVKLDPETKGYSKEQEGDLEKYYAWKQRKLMLDHTTLQEILHTLEDTYGIAIQVEDSAMFTRSASGSMPLPENEEQLLNNIVLLYDLTYEKQSDHIVFKVK